MATQEINVSEALMAEINAATPEQIVARISNYLAQIPLSYNDHVINQLLLDRLQKLAEENSNGNDNSRSTVSYQETDNANLKYFTE